jgi:formylmethanofuran dehydrogenase subunit E
MKINTYSREEYLQQLKSFHGNQAPGLIIGWSMVNLALRSLPEEGLFNAVCETPACLPDAIQLLTSCTIGNGRLTVLNIGRFAAALYEIYGGVGVRVYLDSIKLKKYPEINSWFFKLKSKREQDFQLLISQILEAEEQIVSMQRVRVQPVSLRRKKMGPVADCPLCGESYPVRDGLSCRACQGESPYVEVETPELIGESPNFAYNGAI